jgi:hypothetical protein
MKGVADWPICGACVLELCALSVWRRLQALEQACWKPRHDFRMEAHNLPLLLARCRKRRRRRRIHLEH